MEKFQIKSKVHDFSKKSIITDLKKLFLISKILGDVPFNSDFQYNILLLVYSLSTYMLIGASGYICLSDQSEFKGFNKMLVTVNYVQFILLAIALILIILSNNKMKNGLIKIIKEINYFDLSLNRFGYLNDYNYNDCWIGTAVDFIIVCLVLTLDLIFSDGIDKIPYISSTVYYYFAFVKLFCYKRTICNVMYVFKVRFKTLLELLQSESNVEELCYLHHKLVVGANRVNSTFGPQMLGLTSVLFIVMVIFLYVLTASIAKIQGSEKESQIGFIIVILSWVCMAVYNIYQLITSATSTSDMANDFNRAIKELISRDDAGVLSTSMLAAATTYLVILVQFSPAPSQ